MYNEELEKKEEEELDDYYEKLIEPRPLDETIATKSFSMSTVHENLNVIEEYDENKKSRGKRSKKSKKKTTAENPEIKEEEDELDSEEEK